MQRGQQPVAGKGHHREVRQNVGKRTSAQREEHDDGHQPAECHRFDEVARAVAVNRNLTGKIADARGVFQRAVHEVPAFAVNEHRFNALQKLVGIFPEADGVMLQAVGNLARPRSQPDKDQQIKSAEYHC